MIGGANVVKLEHLLHQGCGGAQLCGVRGVWRPGGLAALRPGAAAAVTNSGFGGLILGVDARRGSGDCRDGVVRGRRPPGLGAAAQVQFPDRPGGAKPINVDLSHAAVAIAGGCGCDGNLAGDKSTRALSPAVCGRLRGSVDTGLAGVGNVAASVVPKVDALWVEKLFQERHFVWLGTTVRKIQCQNQLKKHAWVLGRSVRGCIVRGRAGSCAPPPEIDPPPPHPRGPPCPC